MNRLIYVALVVGSFSLAGQAQAPQSALMVVLDTDRDGALSAQEIERASVALRRLDRDRDGRLDARELSHRFGPPVGAGGPESPRDAVKRLMRFDRNADGKLDRSELPEAMQGLWKHADGNKDGIITQAELETMMRQGSRPAAL